MSRHDEIRGQYFDLRLLRRFLPLASPYRRSALWGLLLLPFISLIRTFQPLLLKWAIDNSILPGELSRLLPLAALFLLLLLVEGGLVFWQSLQVQIVGQKIMADLRATGFAKLLRLPQTFYDWQPSGRILTRLTSDIENVGELFGSGLISAMGDILTLLFILTVMLSINVKLSLVAFAVVPLLLIVISLIRKPMRTVMRQLRARLASLNGYITEHISGIAEVQIFGQQQRVENEFDQLQKEYRQTALRWVSLETFFYASVHTFGSLAVAAILWKGGGEVLSGTATFGTLVAFIEYTRKFFMPLTELASKFSILQTSNASLERIFDLLDEEEKEEGQKELPDHPGEVIFRDLSFAYKKEEPLLKGINLHLQPGKTLALVGDTGSGKSTIAQLLLGFYKPVSGRIEINGEDIQSVTKRSLHRQVGWVSQEPFLFAGTVRENIDPENSREDEELLSCLHLVGADQTLQKLGGLPASISEKGKNLSSGERQLLCLARTMVQNPQILILDEATSHLDNDTEDLVYRGMKALAGGRTTLMIAHRLRLAVEADHIVVLHQGAICEQGDHNQLLQTDGHYARLWRIQQLRD